MTAMYDMIGDIHGHADELSELLEKLGYSKLDGAYRHRSRTAVFVGDFIDRGSQIRETLDLVRAMCEAGTALAVMGNHEFNAIAYHTADPSNADRHLRPHSEKNTHQHSATLAQLSVDELQDCVEWFRQLPMWLELDGVKIVHACWDNQKMAVIDSARKAHDGVSTSFMCDATDPGTELFDAIEDVLKGKELRLPDDCFYRDKDGHERRKIRIQWYRSPVDQTYASYALSVHGGLPTEPLPDSLIESVTPYPLDADPVFFGHYWLRSDRPAPLAANVACLDYSVAKGGSLCAYRWDGESELSDDKFLWVPSK